mmetsp:Transcript_126629/g.300850  ORF Transcript_126629/g.300850 Transcript_126629/m.300850 type:complete len:214 (+) Transcript_126629:679-1320(+)
MGCQWCWAQVADHQGTNLPEPPLSAKLQHGGNTDCQVGLPLFEALLAHAQQVESAASQTRRFARQNHRACQELQSPGGTICGASARVAHLEDMDEDISPKYVEDAGDACHPSAHIGQSLVPQEGPGRLPLHHKEKAKGGDPVVAGRVLGHVRVLAHSQQQHLCGAQQGDHPKQLRRDDGPPALQIVHTKLVLTRAVRLAHQGVQSVGQADGYA